MIPENLKDILSSESNSGFWQTFSMILFLVVFAALVFYVMSRSKKHYDEDAYAPLQDDEPSDYKN